MRRIGAAILLVLSLSTHASATEPSRDWRLVARANIVALATLSVPKNAKGGIASRDDYASIEIHAERVMKGSLPPGLHIRQYLSDQPYYVKQQALLALDTKPAIAFLVLATDGAYHPALYFADEHGVEPAKAARLVEVDAEIARQNDVLARWRPDSALKDSTAVKALIDKTTTKDGAAQAYKDLETLGRRGGVRAIIAQMDDRRDLGVQWIDLVNPPNSWEGIRHYGLKKVVDALSAILGQITAESFGDIVNGGSDAERDHDVAGWRIYDDILRNHPDLLKH